MVYTNYKHCTHISDGNISSEYPKQVKMNMSKIKEKLFLGRNSFLDCFLDNSPLHHQGEEKR